MIYADRDSGVDYAYCKGHGLLRCHAALSLCKWGFGSYLQQQSSVAIRRFLAVQNLSHRLALCKLVYQFVKIPNLPHKRFFHCFHANTAHDAFDQRAFRIGSGRVSEEIAVCNFACESRFDCFRGISGQP